MLQKPDVLKVDIEGVILPKHPEKDSPSALRIAFIIKQIEKYRQQNKLKPLSQYQPPTDFLWDRFQMELGWVIDRLCPNPFSLFQQVVFKKNQEINELMPVAKDIIKRSVNYYLELVKERNIKYEPNPGIIELLMKIKNELKIPFRVLSGNPKLVAEDKLRRVGILDLFLEDNQLPDLSIYDEDILTRGSAIDTIHYQLSQSLILQNTYI